jgi:GTP-binding protein
MFIFFVAKYAVLIGDAVKFVDEVTITTRAGDGGGGAKTFRREKFIPYGGPDGGNGGGGGSVYVVGDRNKHTLLDFQFEPKWEAENGIPGAGRGKDGRRGKDIEISVPLGTIIIDSETKEHLADVVHDKQRVLIAKGGRGGKGNTFFKSATNQVPEYAQPGETGEVRSCLLSLKLLADAGIIGLPNAGKSTLISRISAARPKVADYPFTTLTPTLGVVRVGTDKTMVVADIPGLIEGASEGRGLGATFLKHVERTKILVHLIDAGTPILELGVEEGVTAAVAAYKVIQTELQAFATDLTHRPQILALSKSELFAAPEYREQLTKAFLAEGVIPSFISSATGEGIEALVNQVSKAVFDQREPAIEPSNPFD